MINIWDSHIILENKAKASQIYLNNVVMRNTVDVTGGKSRQITKLVSVNVIHNEQYTLIECNCTVNLTVNFIYKFFIALKKYNIIT
jgi:hypothetical protein